VNRKTLLVAWAAICVVAFGFLMRWISSSTREAPPVIHAQPRQPNIAPVPTDAPAATQLPDGPYEPSDPRWAEVRQKDKLDARWEWKLPVNFYGRVVDEKEQPVAGAKVEFSWTTLNREGTAQETTVSDAQGAFQLLNKQGKSLVVRVSKDGYYTPKQQQMSFDYSAFWKADYYQPNPRNPVLFHLRKKGEGERLSSGEIRPVIPANGTPVRVDLLNGGRVLPEGQLEIAAVTNTEEYSPRLFDWRASIAVPGGGGLVEHNSEFPFEAPQYGYQPRVEFNMLASSPDWKRAIQKSYFIQFGSPPKYGRIQVEFVGTSQEVSISFAVNPSGSRTLEMAQPPQTSDR
jgi:hypothetical protein